MSKPLIGISGSLNDAEKQVFLVRAYMQAILGAGGIPVLLSPEMTGETLSECLDRLDGLMLAGGGDVVPERYGQSAIPELGETTPLRDTFELSILPMAIDRAIPVLGICRGIQVLNVALGGTLYQDLATQHPAKTCGLLPHQQTQPYETPTHGVQVEADSLLCRLLDSQHCLVNSMHHQAADTVAPALRIVARAEDGVIEGLAHPGLPFFVGVQLHPERLDDTASKGLFSGFVQAAKAHRREKA